MKEIAPKTTGERLSAAVLGVKGSLLPETHGSKAHPVDENPMYRLKLLIVSIQLLLCCTHRLIIV